MVDFANSFVYKASTPTKMSNYAGNTYSDVEAGQTCQTSATPPVDVSPKPSSTGKTDSAGANAFGWDIPFSCATMSQIVTDAAGNDYLNYDLYWNSQFEDSTLTNLQTMYQLGQVRMSCKINLSYQEDAAAITITEDDAVSDVDKFLDVAAGLELQVNSVSLGLFSHKKITYMGHFSNVFELSAQLAFDEGSPIDESVLGTTTIQSGTTGSTSITYTSATNAKIGDYMELKLAEVGNSGLLTALS